MAVLVLTDVKIVINGVNLSDHATSCTVSIDVDDVETTAFGSGWKSRTGGLKDGKLDIEFNQDYAAASVDATIWAAAMAGVPIAFTAKATTGATSATNPEYQGSVLPTQATPIDGGVGDLAKMKISWPTSGAITRAVA
jgi:hypothetical protein